MRIIRRPLDAWSGEFVKNFTIYRRKKARLSPPGRLIHSIVPQDYCRTTENPGRFALFRRRNLASPNRNDATSGSFARPMPGAGKLVRHPGRTWNFSPGLGHEKAS